MTIPAQTTPAPSPIGTFLVFCGGGAPHAALADRLPAAEFVIAADSGLDLALALGYRADLVVGDFDSVSPAALDEAVASGAVIERHDPVKDQTDLELALGAALASGAQKVVVVGGAGGRLDHVLANALTMAAPAWNTLELSAVFGAGRLWICLDHVAFTGTAGEYVSLLAVGGAARGVRTEGLRWTLEGETLWSGSGRGVSNEFVAAEASVHVEAGTIVVVAPGEHPPDQRPQGSDP